MKKSKKQVTIPVELSLKTYRKLKKLAKLAGVDMNQFATVLVVCHLWQEGALGEEITKEIAI